MVTHTAVCANLERLHALGLAHKIARSYGIKLEAITGGARHPRVVMARHHLWTILRHTLLLSYPEIAIVFGADHSTVLVAVRKCEARLAAEHAAGALAKCSPGDDERPSREVA